MTQLVSLFPDVHHAAEEINVSFSDLFNSEECRHRISATDVRSDAGVICDSYSVYDILKCLKTNKAMGSDHIPPVLLKVAAQFICEPLAYIFNFSHSRSYVPEDSGYCSCAENFSSLKRKVEAYFFVTDC